MKIAELLSENKYYSKAYANLVFCIEEAAKSKICMLYNSWLTEQMAAKKSGREPQRPKVELETVQKMFSAHTNKHITILTQTILRLTNTFDKGIRTSVMSAISNENSHLCAEIDVILKIFKNIQKKREMAMFVEADGSGPKNITPQDYDDLYLYAKKAVDEVNGMTIPMIRPYEQTESKVKSMLEKYVKESR